MAIATSQAVDWFKLCRVTTAVLACAVGYVTGGCSPAKDAQSVTQPSAQVRKAPNIITPPKPEPKTPLETAHEIHNHGLGGAKLYAALEQAHDVLPTCPWTSGAKASSWKGVRLNHTGAGLDAIQVRSDLTTAADLLLALATNQDAALTDLFVVGPDGAVCHVQEAFHRRDLDLGEDGLSGRNAVAFQRVSGSQIQPGANYYICFEVPGRRPMDVQLKLKLLTNELPPTPVTIHELAKALDFELPFQFSAAASLIERVRDTLEFSGRDAALQQLDEAEAQGTSGRQIAYFKALITHEAAKHLAAADNRDAADPLFLEAAQLFRAAGRAYSQFTTDEERSFGSAFYDEACVYALRGEHAKAIKSLNAAILFRFAKIHYMQEDEDLAGLRDLPEFQKLVSEYLDEMP